MEGSLAAKAPWALAIWWLALICAPAAGAEPPAGKSASQPGGPAALFVSPAGKDRNPGTQAEPFATLSRARRAVRDLKKRGLPAGGVVVYLRGGTYRLDGPFELTAADSGTQRSPIRYRAYKGEEVRITGGAALSLSDFKAVTDRAVVSRLGEAAAHVRVIDLTKLDLPDLAPWPVSTRSGAPGTMELFFNDRPMPVARWPNKGWAKIAKVIQHGSNAVWHQKPARAGAFAYSGDRAKRWKVAEGVWITGYLNRDWYDEAIRVDAIDLEQQNIRLAAAAGFGIGGKGKYRAVNLLDELDAPGEWYLDTKRSLLYFRPPEAKAPQKARIVLSVLTKPLVVMNGADCVMLEGLILEATRGPGVTIAGGAGCRVTNCLIRNTGGYGVEIPSGTDHGVARCEITSTGLGGVRLAGGDRKTLTPAGNFVTENHIHDFSRLQRSFAPGIMVRGVGNRAAHNHIHDAPHEAIHFLGNENVVEFNEIHNVCYECGDVGVIYTGRDWTVRGNVIRYNFIHHVSSPGRWSAQGIYLDDAASGSIVRGNILYKVQRAMLCGGGRDNVIENNLIIDCPASLAFDGRGLSWLKRNAKEGGVWRNNLARMPYTKPPWSTRYPKLAKILDGQPGAPKGNVIRRNVISASGQWRLADPVRKFGTISDNFITPGPLGLVNKKQMDFRLKKSSPVFSKVPGFKPIPFEKIGLKVPVGPKALDSR